MAEAGNERNLTKGEKTKYRLARAMKECMKSTSVDNIIPLQTDYRKLWAYQADFLPEFSG